MANNTASVHRLKEFKFRVEVNGFDSLLVQEFSIGKRTIAVTKHAGMGQNHPTKEAGGLEFENAVLRHVVPCSGDSATFWLEKMKLAQDATTGNGQTPDKYKFTFSCYENKPSDHTVRSWTFFGAFVVSDSVTNKNSMAWDKDVIDEVEIAYDRVEEKRH